MRKRCNRIIAVGLSVILVTATISGCNKSDYQTTDIDISSMIDTERIIEDTTRSILESIEETPSVEDIINVSELMLVSDNWEDYIGDFETIAYGLLANELKYRYDIFPAYVVLSDGTPVYGMGYTDYSTCYTNEDETDVVFEAGLLPYYGELDIPEADFNAGLDLYDIDFQTEGYGFLLTYESDEFTEHCVVYGKYLRYGVDAEGHIFYDAQEFDRDKCDESLGSLYSFDEQRYLLDTDIGDYMPISGISLSEEIDFDELEKEINAILDEQDFNLADVDIEESVYLAQEAVQSYLLSLQEETFLGCSVDYLVELAGELDPMECYRITNDGLMVIDIEEPENRASTLCKWLVGSACVIAVIVGAVGSYVCRECPPLSALSGALVGVGIEVFLQVVFSGKALDSVNWRDVGLAAAAGAVSGLLGAYVNAQYDGVSAALIDTALDGLIGGIEKASAALLNGESLNKALSEGGYGIAMGIAFSGAFKMISKAIGKIASRVGTSIAKQSEKIFPKLSNKVSKIASGIKDGITDKLTKWTKKVNESIFHSEYIANKYTFKQLNRFLTDTDNPITEKALKTLKNNKEILDLDGNIISKNEIKDIFEKAADGKTIGKIKIDDEYVELRKINGLLCAVFDETKYQSVSISMLVDSRKQNMKEAAGLLKEKWLDNPMLIPTEIKNTLKIKNLDLEDLMPNDIVDVIRESGMVLHEMSLQTIQLVPKEKHDLAEGGVKHMGGYGFAKNIKQLMGVEFFEKLRLAFSNMG